MLFQNLDLKASLQILVIDEADLVFSYGYEHDLKTLLGYVYIVTYETVFGVDENENLQIVENVGS